MDEAHGGHLYFGKKGGKSGELPRGDEISPAQILRQSMHKVTGSLGQSSLLHVGSSRIDRGRLESALHLVQSTSPSYLLVTSLECQPDTNCLPALPALPCPALHGEEMLEKTCQMAEDARERIRQIPGMECYGKELLGEKIYDLDTTRLVISASALGLTGFELADILYEEY